MRELKKEITRDILHVVPTMDIVVFPRMIVPLFVMDKRIIFGIEKAVKESKKIYILASSKYEKSQEPISAKDLYNVGTVASVMRVVNLSEGIKILVQGLYRASAYELMSDEKTLKASIERLDFLRVDNELAVKAHIKNIKELLEKINSCGNIIPFDLQNILSRINEPEKIIDFVVSHLNLNVPQAQKLLEINKIEELLAEVYKLLSKEVEVAEIQEEIINKTRESLNSSQKEFYLREQLKTIHKELGDDISDVEKYKEKIKKLSLSKEAEIEVFRQLKRLEKMPFESMESSVVRNYLDWILDLPWGIYTEDNLDIIHAKRILEEDHYGLREIKERILDFISIKNLKRDGPAPILCFVGPPGTGKTSLGRSIARSLEREYVRVSLGGVRDESEIRGHRRTYVGAMPGRFIQGIRKAGSSNPIIVIDEIDKLGSDYKGDPSSAMLEVLDPQQNKDFYDNYLGLPFDLSKVIFIATANTLDTISAPLRDRMEIIQLTGYTIEEKMEIAKRHMINKILIDSGLDGRDINISNEVLKDIILYYTRESGVRQLERVIKKICSKMARIFVERSQISELTSENITDYLGPKLFLEDDVNKEPQIGVANGLAWTIYGGEMIKIEAVLMPGKGKLILTGQLGNVMKESAQAALSYARSHSKEFNINENVFIENDLHIHVPAGGVPKDGPSAGITMLTSILSALTGRPINAEYAMTGELNLHGEVMPIGGVKEKILAAKRNNIPFVIIPHKNKNDILGLEDIVKDINIIFVEKADEILKYVLMPKKLRNNIRCH